jgi:hypothetical protein
MLGEGDCGDILALLWRERIEGEGGAQERTLTLALSHERERENKRLNKFSFRYG